MHLVQKRGARHVAAPPARPGGDKQPSVQMPSMAAMCCDQWQATTQVHTAAPVSGCFGRHDDNTEAVWDSVMQYWKDIWNEPQIHQTRNAFKETLNDYAKFIEEKTALARGNDGARANLVDALHVLAEQVRAARQALIEKGSSFTVGLKKRSPNEYITRMQDVLQQLQVRMKYVSGRW